MILRLRAGSLPAARYCASMSLAVAAENSSLKLRLIQSASSSAVRRRVLGPSAEIETGRPTARRGLRHAHPPGCVRPRARRQPGRRVNQEPILLFDRNRGHPSVPTRLLPERGAQARSRMPLAAPPKAALSVLDGAEHSAMLVRQGRHRRECPLGLPPRQNRLDHWWGVPTRIRWKVGPRSAPIGTPSKSEFINQCPSWPP